MAPVCAEAISALCARCRALRCRRDVVKAAYAQLGVAKQSRSVLLWQESLSAAGAARLSPFRIRWCIPRNSGRRARSVLRRANAWVAARAEKSGESEKGGHGHNRNQMCNRDEHISGTSGSLPWLTAIVRGAESLKYAPS